MSRRNFLTAAGASAWLLSKTSLASLEGAKSMFGLIGKMNVTAGQRDAVISILLDGIDGMPGCLSYIVARDTADPNAIWVTEVWDSSESHRASLSRSSVKQAIARAKPLIAGFGERFETVPVGGHGLVDAKAR